MVKQNIMKVIVQKVRHGNSIYHWKAILALSEATWNLSPNDELCSIFRDAVTKVMPQVIETISVSDIRKGLSGVLHLLETKAFSGRKLVRSGFVGFLADLREMDKIRRSSDVSYIDHLINRINDKILWYSDEERAQVFKRFLDR